MRKSASYYRRYGAAPGTFFGTSAQFWLNLQPSYDLSVAEAQLRKQIEQDVRPYAA
jgi:plasmid maintenance system antidote protein VapI